jgi:hypothetical protein
MKYIIALSLILGFSSLNAETNTQRELKITSFLFVDGHNHQNRAAELCGHVTGNVHLHDRITVTADYTTKGPAPYTTLLSEDGKFCVTIRTLTGRASAKFWRLGNSELSLSANANIEK